MKTKGTIVMVLLALAFAAPGAFAAGYDGLLPLLVDLPGWNAEPADGAEANSEGVKAVSADRTYENGNRKFEAHILIGMQAGTTWAPQFTEGYKMESPEGIVEVKRINGFLVSIIFENESKSGGIVVLLQSDASKPDLGSVFATSFEGLALDEALKTAQRFDWAKMKAQAARLK